MSLHQSPPGAQRAPRPPSALHRLAPWLRAFLPAAFPVDGTERLRIVLGAFVGVVAMGAAARLLGGLLPSGGWLLAPLGASAVLVFAAPASPLAQPWSVVGGNLISALVGMACAALIPEPLLAAGCAVALAIAAMLLLRCLHPPGGAMALLAVLAHAGSGRFPLDAAALDTVLLVGVGLIFHPLTGRRYPHAQIAPGPAVAPGTLGGRRGLQASDLDAVLARYNQILDVSRDDLEALLLAAELEGHRRRVGDLRCRDVMSREPVAVEFGTPLREAWELMRNRRIKALPVLDRGRRLVGILTTADILRAAGLESHSGLAARLRRFLAADGLTHSEKPEAVGQVMTHTVRVARQDDHVIDLLPIFNATGHHHLPIVDAERRVVGMLTQSDLVRVLQESNALAPLAAAAAT